MAQIIGEVTGRLKSTYEWKIQDIFLLSDKAGDCFESPPLECIDGTWKLTLYPNGYSEEYAGCVSLFVNTKNKKISQSYCLNICLKNENGVSITSKQIKSELIQHGQVELKKFVMRSEIFNMIHLRNCPTGFGFGNTTPIGFGTPSSPRVRAAVIISFQTILDDLVEDATSGRLSKERSLFLQNPKASRSTLINNIKVMFLNGTDTDVVIKTRGKEFPVHRCILRARCPVLDNCFSHDMLEKRRNSVNFDDFEPDIVREFLIYIYNGDIDNMNKDNMFDLYAIAHKNQMEEMKEECLLFIQNNISLETICDTLVLAKHYSELELLNLATIFVTRNFKKVIESDNWKQLEEQCKEEKDDLLYQCLKNIILENSTRVK